jgi:Rrf2 family transcriptional regulator, nitric oxide-sensitive transcriptional repressor
MGIANTYLGSPATRRHAGTFAFPGEARHGWGVHLTVRTDLALRVLLVLAAHPTLEVATSQLAEDFDVSLFHLQKIAKDLTKLGWVATSRGRGGGLRLRVPPAELRLDAVVRALEPDLALVACFPGATGPTAPETRARPACRLNGSCRLRSALDAALEAFLAVLATYTLEDLAQHPTPEALIPFGRGKPLSGR